jgi:transketolase
MRNTFMNTVIDALKTREDLFILAGDAGLGVFDDVKQAYPERFQNLGVAEQNTIGMASGLAMTGFKVYVYNIIPFVLYRCYEQVRNDICYQKLPVTLVGIGSGITYAPQGMTHYSVEDIGLARTLPNLTVISPCDPVEAKRAAEYSLKSTMPLYVRLAKRGEPVVHSNDDIDITLPLVLRDGTDVAVLFHGSIVAEVLKAHEQLASEGIHPLIVSVPMLQPLRKEVLLNLLRKVRHVVTIEEHYTIGGLGDIIRKLSGESSSTWGLTTLGIPHRFLHEIMDTDTMRKHLGISSTHLAAAVRTSLL